MKMKNTSNLPVLVPREIVPKVTNVRHGKAVIQPGEVVEVPDEYAVRRRAQWSLGKDDGTNVMPAIVDQVSGGKLKPEGLEAVELYASTFHDQLPQIVAVFEELKRRDEIERRDVMKP